MPCSVRPGCRDPHAAGVVKIRHPRSTATSSARQGARSDRRRMGLSLATARRSSPHRGLAGGALSGTTGRVASFTSPSFDHAAHHYREDYGRHDSAEGRACSCLHVAMAYEERRLLVVEPRVVLLASRRRALHRKPSLLWSRDDAAARTTHPRTSARPTTRLDDSY